jgi:acyl-coenzyme A synthetase/AMP-(fatty) acid ligase
MLKMNALNYPDKLGCQDKNKAFTFKEWNARTCQLANALTCMGIGYQDRFAIIAYNRVEWLEIYGSCAKGGQVMVPIMFRLAPPEIEYNVNHSGCKAFIVEEPFVKTINSIRHKLTTISADHYIYMGEGKAPDGYVHYEEIVNQASPNEPDIMVDAADMWTIMYTSGTTGKPKGVVRTHEAVLGQYYNANITQGVLPTDKALLVMPMCHVNSIHYSYSYTLVTASIMVYDMISFDPEDMLKTLSEYHITFTSLVPTHYIMMLALPDEVKNAFDVGQVRQLLISSAPARKDLKLAIMDHFKNAELWEAYGSTEAGLVTMLRPEDQFRKLGSIGKEVFGSDRIKILDDDGHMVPDGEVGELYSRTPSVFKEYWNDPEKTKAAFKDGWFSAGDMCKRDEEGYYYLVDRKANMIITGGENVYPSEVENVISAHEAVKEIAVIGIPDKKWGDAVKAVVVLHDDFQPNDTLAAEIMDFCKGKIAGYKRPKSVDFIKDEEMPRTGTGKIMHRVLRERYSALQDE